MQRIDENTYIDDTLVTCAEYQLFIDEMREQGKHCQPYHWTSYQFPKGKAREPILGVRLDEANAFCDWLASREAGEWGYRLPTLAEAKDHTTNLIFDYPPCGYWTIEKDMSHQFVWVVSSFTKLDTKHIDDSPHAVPLLQTVAVDLARVLAYTFDLNPYLVRELDLERDRYLARDLSRLLSHFPASNQTLTRLNQRPHDYDFAINLAVTNALNNSYGNVLDLDSAPVEDDALSTTLDLLLNNIILLERIAGRSPAFEGIRLVKERIR
jgi:hypothetical protein